MKLQELKFIFKPQYWIMNNPYSHVADKLVSGLLDKYDFTEITPVTAKLGPVKIWIGNRPYACMTIEDFELGQFRPSRLTIERGIKKLGSRISQAKRERDDAIIKKYLQ